MSRAPSLQQRDITRVLKAAKAAGVDVVKIQVKLEDGKVAIVMATTDAGNHDTNELDKWLIEHAD